jgi:hypothetical protein
MTSQFFGNSSRDEAPCEPGYSLSKNLRFPPRETPRLLDLAVPQDFQGSEIMERGWDCFCGAERTFFEIVQRIFPMAESYHQKRLMFCDEDDATLLEKSREGDEQAFAALFHRYYESVDRYVNFCRVGPGSRLIDVVDAASGALIGSGAGGASRLKIPAETPARVGYRCRLHRSRTGGDLSASHAGNPGTLFRHSPESQRNGPPF